MAQKTDWGTLSRVIRLEEEIEQTNDNLLKQSKQTNDLIDQKFNKLFNLLISKEQQEIIKINERLSFLSNNKLKHPDFDGLYYEDQPYKFFYYPLKAYEKEGYINNVINDSRTFLNIRKNAALCDISFEDNKGTKYKIEKEFIFDPCFRQDEMNKKLNEHYNIIEKEICKILVDILKRYKYKLENLKIEHIIKIPLYENKYIM